MPTLPASTAALVIGAGPAGLAAAAELRRHGFDDVLVLERSAEVGSSWAGHYDRLHLHTTRSLSSLPGRRIPRRFGRWVARDDLREYLRDYATANDLDVRLGVGARSVTREADGRWRVETDAGAVSAGLVVVATGYNHTPKVPRWPGREGYRGRVIHSSDYRNPDQLGAQRVLVVGPGNSGAEIAADLAGAGIDVELAIRTPPNLVRREVLGIPSQVLVLSISPLPARLGDRVARLLQKLTVGDLSRYGLPRAPRGIVTQAARDDVIPTIDVGLIDAVRAGRVTVVPAVESFAAESVRLADGREARPDVVIVAAGYERGLEPLVGALGVLEASGRPMVNAEVQVPGLEGLYFLGYSNPLTGNIRQIAIDARRIARHAGQHRA
jgi:putative flavoprotein involved in K+ transport